MADREIRVWVSYPSAARQQVTRITDRLSLFAAGRLVFDDQLNPPAGRDWKDWAREALRSTDLLMLIQPETGTPLDWQLYELGLFLGPTLASPTETKPVVVVAEDEPTGVLLLSSSIHVRPIESELQAFLHKFFGTSDLLPAHPPLNDTLASNPEELRVLAQMIAEQIALSRSSGSVFVSYAHRDMETVNWIDHLDPFLAQLERDKGVERFIDQQILAGENWRDEIEKALERTDVAILVIGQCFLASDFVINHELPTLLARAEKEGVKIKPLLVSHCLYHRSDLERFQAFNDPDKPLESLSTADRNRMLRDFVDEIWEVFETQG